MSPMEEDGLRMGRMFGQFRKTAGQPALAGHIVLRARVEGQEVFRELADRYPNLELKTHDMDYQPSITFRSIKSLPVSLN